MTDNRSTINLLGELDEDQAIAVVQHRLISQGIFRQNSLLYGAQAYDKTYSVSILQYRLGPSGETRIRHELCPKQLSMLD